MQLVSRQMRPPKFDGELVAKAIQLSAGSLTLVVDIIGQLQEQPHLGPRSEAKLFVGFQHSVDERGRDQLCHNGKLPDLSQQSALHE